jgi:hypothetical protein
MRRARTGSTLLSLMIALCGAAAAQPAVAPEHRPAQARRSLADRPVVMAQGGFTFGPRDDLGPRYDPYSERDRYRNTDTVVCRWVEVRAQRPDGKPVLRRQRICGFKVPARQ